MHSVYLNFDRRLPHSSKSFHVLESLHHNCSLEHEEHSKSKETVVPVLIHKPQSRAKDLKHEEGCHQMLHVNFMELGNRNLNLVLAPYQSCLFLFLFILNTLCFLIVVDCFFNRIWNMCECFTLRVVQEALLANFYLVCLVH